MTTYNFYQFSNAIPNSIRSEIVELAFLIQTKEITQRIALNAIRARDFLQASSRSERLREVALSVVNAEISACIAQADRIRLREIDTLEDKLKKQADLFRLVKRGNRIVKTQREYIALCGSDDFSALNQ